MLSLSFYKELTLQDDQFPIHHQAGPTWYYRRVLSHVYAERMRRSQGLRTYPPVTHITGRQSMKYPESSDSHDLRPQRR